MPDTDVFLSDIDEQPKKLAITFLLDESSSMQSIAPATLNGVNEFIQSQKNLDDGIDVSFELLTFSTPGSLTTKLERRGIEEVANLQEFKPGGYSTALYDAMDQTISQVEKAIADDDNTTALVIVMTDGANNAGTVTKEKVFERITALEATEKWKFVYLGANQDAYAEGSGMGIAGGSTLTYAATSAGVAQSTNSTTYYTRGLRNTLYAGGDISRVSFADTGTTNEPHFINVDPDNSETHNHAEDEDNS